MAAVEYLSNTKYIVFDIGNVWILGLQYSDNNFNNLQILRGAKARVHQLRRQGCHAELPHLGPTPLKSVQGRPFHSQAHHTRRPVPPHPPL